MLRRPLMAACLIYMVFLLTVLVLFPSAGERVFGYEKRRRELSSVLQQQTSGFEVTIRRAGRTRTRYRYTASYTLSSSEGDMCGQCLLDFQEDPGLSAGDHVWVQGTVSLPEKAQNPGQWDESSYSLMQGYDFTIEPIRMRRNAASGFSLQRMLDKIRSAVSARIDTLFEAPYAGMVKAMILGESWAVDREILQVLREAGTAHIIAISGIHLSLICSMLLRFLNRLLPPRKAFAAADILTWLYVFLVGGSLSSVRAAVMLTFSGLAPLLHRKADHFSSVLASMLILLLINPFYFLNAGFWLSFLALFGLSLGPCLLELIPAMPAMLRRKLGPSLGVSLFTYPVSRLFFHQASLISFVVNLVVVPSCGLILTSALAAVAAGFLFSPLAAGFVFLAEQMLRLLTFFSRQTAGLSCFMTKGTFYPYQMVFWYSTLFVLLWLINSRLSHRRLASLCLCAVCLVLVFSPRSGWRLGFLSVGQGECCVIEWENRTVVVDAGPSCSTVIEPYLLYRGIRQIDVLVLSHPDADHIQGALTLAEEGFPIQLLLEADAPSTVTDRQRQLEELVRKHGGQVRYLQKADVCRLSASHGRKVLTITALSPDTDYGSSNENCLVVCISPDDTHRWYFTGDIDREVEQSLAQDSGFLTENSEKMQIVLKQAHHGSQSGADPMFLSWTKADLTVISCGKNNPYGHPHAQTIRTLRRLGMPYVITKDCGAVFVEQMGHSHDTVYKTYLQWESE